MERESLRLRVFVFEVVTSTGHSAYVLRRYLRVACEVPARLRGGRVEAHALHKGVEALPLLVASSQDAAPLTCTLIYYNVNVIIQNGHF